MTGNFAGLPRLLTAGINRLSILAAAGAMMFASAAAGPIEVALVESMSGNTSTVGYMDYLKPGQVIRLGARDTLVLTYMSSCVRETIRGGTVTIGTDSSDVQSGEVVRNSGANAEWARSCSPAPKPRSGAEPSAALLTEVVSCPRDVERGRKSHHVFAASLIKIS